MTALQLDPVIGRDKELGMVEAWLLGGDASPPALLIEGEPGVGKTTVWRHALRRAELLGSRVLRCEPGEAELKLGYAGLADLLDSVSATQLAVLPPPQRQAMETALLRIATPDQPLDPRTVSTGLLSLLRLLAQEGPLILAVDDLHWLDAPSAKALGFAARRLGRRVRYIAAARLSVELPIGLAGDNLTRLELGPLTLAAVHRLLVTRLGRSLPRLVLVKIHQTSRGNPFHALEIARALIRSGATISPGMPLPASESLRALILERIARLPSETREALRFVALGEDVSAESLAGAGFTKPSEVLKPALREGIAVMQGTSIRFAHPLIASAVIAGTSQRRIREIHAVLAVESGSTEAGALHMGLASTGPDPVAADALESAATLARRRGAPIAAGELLELARKLTPVGQAAKLADRIGQAAQSYFEAGAVDRAESLLGELVATSSSGATKARGLQLLSEIRARSYSFSEARALAAEALSLARGDPALEAGIELDLAFSEFCQGDLGGAVAHTADALSHAEAAGATALKAEALASLTITEFFIGRGVSETRLAEAVALEDPLLQVPLEMRPKVIQALLLLWTMRLDESLLMLSSLRTEVIERGQEISLPFVTFYLVIAALWKGDFGLASRHTEECEESAAFSAESIAQAMALAARSLLDAFEGPPEKARSEAAEALMMFRRSSFVVYTTWPLHALGLLELSLGNSRRVDELLRPMADAISSRDIGDPILGIFLPDEIEAVVALGDLDRAARYLGWMERGSQRLDRAWGLAAVNRSHALIAAAKGDLGSAIESLDKALAQHDRVSLPFERARTLLLKGQLHRRRREKRAAIEALQDAVQIFDAVRAVRWSARATSELSRVGLSTKRHGLSATELRVAELAAAGMTNRQVASQAFIAPKTVEANLARAYAKLGIRSRAQLGRALDELKSGSA